MEAYWKIQSGSFRGGGKLHFEFFGMVLVRVSKGKTLLGNTVQSETVNAH